MTDILTIYVIGFTLANLMVFGTGLAYLWIISKTVRREKK